MTFSLLLGLQGAHEQNADTTNERSNIYRDFVPAHGRGVGTR